MSLCLSELFFFLVISLPSGNCLFGNNGVEFHTCTKLNGTCFFGCPPGRQWVAFCHNILSCCKPMSKFLVPQVKEPWST
ncbi:beta-defensin 136 [Otolemur garnettii]|uniref:beta-defensin 136 n=1 Tax=Otolemur garnettii TaxID=30611 RepID=UPI000C7F08BB|nr:beta-defensin 136 [Otolemur garnettii]